MIDLHIHSTFSDGSCTPLKILDIALKEELNAISITDHDTIDGVINVFEKGNISKLEFITGVEISAKPSSDFSEISSVHILGYGFSIYNKDLKSGLKKLKKARARRNPLIIKKLSNLGFDITLEEVKKKCGHRNIGRPHIAQTMVNKQFVPSFNHAFDKFLAKGKPAYVNKFKFSCKETIKLIINAGGIPVLAHPGLLKINKKESIQKFIDKLIKIGLRGIEVYHTDHTKEQTSLFLNIANKKNLIITGGSDFHGKFKQGIKMGYGNGNLYVDYDLYKKLVSELEKFRLANPMLEKLEKNLTYIFNNKSLLLNALYHSSYINELHNKNILDSSNISDNQRFEFLGDAILGFVIGQILMEKYPDLNEGELSKLRAILVSEQGLSVIAKKVDLGRFIFLGKGEKIDKGWMKNSILSDAFEAVIAAIYLDSGFENIYRLIKNYFKFQIEKFDLNKETNDYKSMLQEYVQEMGEESPSYTILQETGPDHNKTFKIEVKIKNLKYKGLGKNKKSAEQNSAKNAMENLKKLQDSAKRKGR